MTIDEAIEIKEKELAARSHYPDSKLRQADKLGLEALRRLQMGRDNSWASWIKPLQGETKD